MDLDLLDIWREKAILTLLHSERLKLYTILAFLSAIGSKPIKHGSILIVTKLSRIIQNVNLFLLTLMQAHKLGNFVVVLNMWLFNTDGSLIPIELKMAKTP